MLDHLIINLDANAESSLQSQIQQSVVEAILARAILPGDKLPSSRALASQLGVSRNTVVLAYQALIDTGYIQPRERSGLYRQQRCPGQPPGGDARHRHG
jgi:GntR family transcriptional regulator/MocR family aminotransferase